MQAARRIGAAATIAVMPERKHFLCAVGSCLAGLGLLCNSAAAAGAQLPLAVRLERQFVAPGGVGSAIAVDLKSGEVVWQHQPDAARIPASVNKLFTTAAVLLDLGPNRRLRTLAMAPTSAAAAATDGGTAPGNDAAALIDFQGNLKGSLFIKGGGDPTLGPTGIGELATAVRAAGVKAIPGKVVGDDGLFDRIRGIPALGGVDPYQGGLLSGLAYDHEGSAQGAATALTLALRRVGVKVPKGHTGTGTAPVAATTLASHDSAPISTLIRLTNQPSDNFYAEMLTKVHGAIKLSLGTTASGLKAAASALARLGVRPTRVDGSGLSRGNRTSARTVERLLAALAANKAFVDSLAVAGKSGTLASRMGGTPAAGRCRGKTGTLSNVIGLAGFCTTQQGRTIAFAMLMNSLDSVSAARHSQDQIVKALATWRPAAPSAKLQ